MPSSQIPNLNYATEYMRALEQAYPYALYYGALYSTPNNGRYKWINSKTIEIPSVSTSGRTDADRDSIATAQRNYNNKWTALTLVNERKWSTLVHPKDIDQTNMATSIGNITKTFNEEHKFPEMDAYCISKIYYDWNALGKSPVATSAPTSSTVLGYFDSMMLAMDNARVPVSGRILYVTNEVKSALKNAAGITRNWDVQTTTLANNITRTVEYLDGVQIIPVPQQLMETAYNFSDKNGWATVTTASKIYMVLIHPTAVITPVSYTFSKLDAPSALTEGKYYYYEESFEDVFVLPNKADAIQMVVDSNAISADTYTKVTTPDPDDLDDYYEVNIDGQYVKTADTVVDFLKTYYTKA